MSGEQVTLAIEKLAGLGDGLGLLNGQRIFVPYTVAGDVVRAKVTRSTKDVSYAALEEIITRGEGRITPVCRHFATCGGCALQHVRDDIYASFKQQTAREAVRKAGFDPDLVLPLVRITAASRRRVELKIADGKLGYYAEGSHRLIDITECKVLEPALETLVLRLKPKLTALQQATWVQINGVDEGYDVVLSMAGAFPPPTPPVNGGRDSEASQFPSRLREGLGEGIIRTSVKDNAGIRTLHQSVPATITLGGVKVEVPPAAFLQASREAQAIMTDAVLAMVGDAGSVLDLFAGLGTYSFPLTHKSDVTAVEGDGTMVSAMAAAGHSLGERFKVIRRDLFRDPVTGFKGYDAVVINPPRTGALAQVQQLARAGVAKLVMVSCNPATFARDGRILKDAGFRLNKVLPIDQFVYTSHLEILAEFIH